MKDVEVLDYKPELAVWFKKLNEAWIAAYFTIEPIDAYVMEQPEEAIINKGGAIIFIKYMGEIVGTAGLKKMDDTSMELTKMAVDETKRGMGLGHYLVNAALHKAESMGAEKVILYTQSGLKAAIAAYNKAGFKTIPIEEGVYERADVKMELDLRNWKENNLQHGSYISTGGNSTV